MEVKLKCTSELDVLQRYEAALQCQKNLERQAKEVDEMLAAAKAATDKYTTLHEQKIAEAEAKVEEIENEVAVMEETLGGKVEVLYHQVEDGILARRAVDDAFDGFCVVAGDALDSLSVGTQASLLHGNMAEVMGTYFNQAEVADWEQWVDFAIEQGYDKRTKEWQVLSQAFSPQWRELSNELREKVKEWQSR